MFDLLKHRRKPDTHTGFPGVILTVTGTLVDFLPAIGRPGCVLILTNGESTGKYYVPMSPHDVRLAWKINNKVRLRISRTARPRNGIYDTLGTESRFWRFIENERSNAS